MTIGMCSERREEIKRIVDEEINNMKLDIYPRRKQEVAIIFEHTEQFDAEEIQYMYDYLEEKNIFKYLLILPSDKIISTMSLKDIALWYKHIGSFLMDKMFLD